MIVPSDSTFVGYNHSQPEVCDNLDTLIFAEGVTYIQEKSAYFFPFVSLPKTLKGISYKAFTGGDRSKVYTVQCNAAIPPKIGNSGSSFYDAYNHIEKMTLYVPQESIELYKNTTGWNQFQTILPIE